MRAFPAAFVALAAALLSCQGSAPTDITPASFLNSLRILGIRAEPPEIAPGASTVTDALVFDPVLDPGNMTYVWIFCEPDPSSMLGSQCEDQQSARDPRAFLQTALFNSNPTVHAQLVTKPRGSYTAPATLLDSLSTGSIDRKKGVIVNVVLIAFESTDFLSVATDTQGTIPRVIATKSILVRDPAPDSNVNPHLDSIRVQGKETPAEPSDVSVAGLTRIELSGLPSHDSAQVFNQYLPDGRTQQQTEELSVTWFTIAGAFEEGFDTASRTAGASPLHLLVTPSDPKQKFIDIYAVLRDGRGGTDWGVRTLVTTP
jgi:hypothetical protein